MELSNKEKNIFNYMTNGISPLLLSEFDFTPIVKEGNRFFRVNIEKAGSIKSFTLKHIAKAEDREYYYLGALYHIEKYFGLNN